MAPGTNLYSEFVSPFEEWISRINLKALLGRSLFQKTHSDKGEFIKSMFKKRGAAISPLQVTLKVSGHPVSSNDDPIIIDCNLTNNSWMGNIEYQIDFDADPKKKYFIVGQSAFAGTLLPLQTALIRLEVVFPYSGVYNLNSWKALVQIVPHEMSTISLAEHRTDSEFVQYPSAPQLITVLQ